MKYAVRYYTKTGNTKRLAEAMAKELGVEALPLRISNRQKKECPFRGGYSRKALSYLSFFSLIAISVSPLVYFEFQDSSPNRYFPEIFFTLKLNCSSSSTMAGSKVSVTSCSSSFTSLSVKSSVSFLSRMSIFL